MTGISSASLRCIGPISNSLALLAVPTRTTSWGVLGGFPYGGCNCWVATRQTTAKRLARRWCESRHTIQRDLYRLFLYEPILAVVGRDGSERKVLQRELTWHSPEDATKS